MPAVIPCGTCPACRDGHGSICPRQIFPGNDVHGGFATHVRVPAHGLCPVPDLADEEVNPADVSLPELSVLADAVSTPYQAILRSGLGAGDLAVFVGAGGVGGFGVQIAAALGAHVVAIDVDADRLALPRVPRRRAHPRRADGDFKALRKAVRTFAKERGRPDLALAHLRDLGHRRRPDDRLRSARARRRTSRSSASRPRRSRSACPT